MLTMHSMTTILFLLPSDFRRIRSSGCQRRRPDDPFSGKRARRAIKPPPHCVPVNTPTSRMKVREWLLKQGLCGRTPEPAVLRTKPHDCQVVPNHTHTADRCPARCDPPQCHPAGIRLRVLRMPLRGDGDDAPCHEHCGATSPACVPDCYTTPSNPPTADFIGTAVEGNLELPVCTACPQDTWVVINHDL